MFRKMVFKKGAHCAGMATLGVDDGGPLGMGTWGAAF